MGPSGGAALCRRGPQTPINFCKSREKYCSVLFFKDKDLSMQYARPVANFSWLRPCTSSSMDGRAALCLPPVMSRRTRRWPLPLSSASRWATARFVTEIPLAVGRGALSVIFAQARRAFSGSKRQRRSMGRTGTPLERSSRQ